MFEALHSTVSTQSNVEFTDSTETGVKRKSYSLTIINVYETHSKASNREGQYEADSLIAIGKCR